MGSCRAFFTARMQIIFFKWDIPSPFFFIFVFSIQLIVNNVQYKLCRRTGFKLQICGVGSDHFTTWAKTTAPCRLMLKSICISWLTRVALFFFRMMTTHFFLEFGIWYLLPAKGKSKQKVEFYNKKVWRSEESQFYKSFSATYCNNMVKPNQFAT